MKRKNITLREKLEFQSGHDVISSGLQNMKWKEHLSSYLSFWLWLITAAEEKLINTV